MTCFGFLEIPFKLSSHCTVFNFFHFDFEHVFVFMGKHQFIIMNFYLDCAHTSVFRKALSETLRVFVSRFLVFFATVFPIELISQCLVFRKEDNLNLNEFNFLICAERQSLFLIAFLVLLCIDHYSDFLSFL